MVFFLTFALLGTGLGVLYDLLRAFRTHFRMKKAGTAVMDGLFCLLGLLSFLLTMLRHTDGRLRGYLALGMCLGFWFYRRAVSAWFLGLLLLLFRLLGQAFTELGTWILWLFSFPRGN